VSRLQFERVDGVPVARPSEDIDAANALVLRDELATSLQGADTLVLDLGATRYVDSAGIDMLFRLAQIVALPSAVAIHETVEQALGAVSPRCGA